MLQDRSEFYTLAKFDPSFPEDLHENRIIEEIFLNDHADNDEHWLENKSAPTISNYLLINTASLGDGFWVTLDGSISQECMDKRRNFIGDVRAFLVAKDNADVIFKKLQDQDISEEWLPEKPTVEYIFAGEIPWSENFEIHK